MWRELFLLPECTATHVTVSEISAMNYFLLNSLLSLQNQHFANGNLNEKGNITFLLASGRESYYFTVADRCNFSSSD